MSNNKNKIGFWGYPDPQTIEQLKQKYPNHQFLDLDIDYKYPSSGILPEAYCKIIRNIMDNSIHLKNELDFIIGAVGEEKCDAGRFVSLLLKDIGFNVIETKFEKYPDIEIKTPISQSNLPLEKKIITIMDGVIKTQKTDYEYINPTHGFWGVPPNDLSFLSLFRNSTHLYGWTRCVEAGRPADMDLEMHVDTNIPTVFFAQTFCAKMQLAKYLAKKHDGLYIDIDDIATNSVKAKVEAFIRLG